VITHPAGPTTAGLRAAAHNVVHSSIHSSGTHLHPWRLIIGAVVIALLAYALACAVTPFAQCRRCDGNGKYRKRTGRAWHPCKRCKGAGYRLRWGRHVTNYIWRTRNHSTRASQQRDRLTGRGQR
jgi:hypothetical protein